MPNDLASFLPTTIQNTQFPVEAIHIQPHHLPYLAPLTSDDTEPLKWFHTEIEKLEDLLHLSDHMVYTILIKGQVAGFFYFKTWKGLKPNELEMAYCVLDSFRRKGVLEVALLTILGILFGVRIPNGRLERVSAFVEENNETSKQAHTKLGFKRLRDVEDDDNPKIIYQHYQIERTSWHQMAKKLETNAKRKFQ